MDEKSTHEPLADTAQMQPVIPSLPLSLTQQRHNKYDHPLLLIQNTRTYSDVNWPLLSEPNIVSRPLLGGYAKLEKKLTINQHGGGSYRSSLNGETKTMNNQP